MDAAARRRLYRRSHTVATLPAHLLPDASQESDNERLLPAHIDSPAMTRHASLEADPEDFSQFALDDTSPAKGKGKRTRFGPTRSISITEPALIREDIPRVRKTSGPGGSMGYTTRPTSTPSNLLSKVKERIREKVFQSSEWPSAAAMLQEKRQRANNALEASLTARKDLNLEQIQMHELYRKKTGRSKSDTTARYEIGVTGGEGETVRQAFIRRRSISEDTYDRKPCTTVKEGVLCSNEDLQAMVSGHKGTFGSRLRRSPNPMKKQIRAVSLDSGKLTRAVIEPGPSTPVTVMSQVSMESSSSTVSSMRTFDSGGSVTSERVDELPPGDELVSEVIHEEESPDTPEQGKATPVPEVVFDEYGQTWDVYGADFDPEILGQAIQRHLERLMGGSRDTSTTPISSDISRPTSTATVKSSEGSFWLRLLCLFSSRKVPS